MSTDTCRALVWKIDYSVLSLYKTLLSLHHLWEYLGHFRKWPPPMSFRMDPSVFQNGLLSEPQCVLVGPLHWLSQNWIVRNRGNSWVVFNHERERDIPLIGNLFAQWPRTNICWDLAIVCINVTSYLGGVQVTGYSCFPGAGRKHDFFIFCPSLLPPSFPPSVPPLSPH